MGRFCARRKRKPAVSHHLKRLHAADLIEMERRGKWAYYSINDDALEVLRAWVY